MSKDSRGKGKTKKVIVGVATIVAVAAIAVPTAITIAGGKDDAGANDNNGIIRYNIIVSSEYENIPDYSISVKNGTKISELKFLLKAIDGYTIIGIYKDQAMNHEFSDNDVLNENTKIYIKYEAQLFTVKIYDASGNLVNTEEVNYGAGISLAEPSKEEDGFAKYIFSGWVNENGDAVNINKIISDINIYPSFKTIIKEYKIGYIFTNNDYKNSLSVSVGGEPVTLDSTYYYGSKVRLRATARENNEVVEFKVKVGNGEIIDVLTEHYRHEENGEVYYECELVGNGDITIIYNEAQKEYSVGVIPAQVTVKRNGHLLSSHESIYYDDQLEITYAETEGYHKESFEVKGAYFSGEVWIVKGNLQITYTEEKNAYNLSTIPENVVIKRGNETLSSGSVIYHGDELLFLFTETTSRLTGNTKQQEGYNYNERETITNSLAINGTNRDSGYVLTVTGNITLKLSSSSTKTWEKGERLQYSLGTIPELVTVKKNGVSLSNNATIYYGDVLEITYHQDYNATTFTVSGASKTGTSSYSVTGNIKIDFVGEYKYKYLTFSECEGGYEVSAFDSTAGITDVVIPATYNGKKVVGIKDLTRKGVFSSTNIRSVTVSAGVEKIGNFAFSKCNSLTSVNLPSGLKTIGTSAFSYCESLSSVSIPSGVTTLGKNAFSNCSELASVTIPSSVNSIEQDTFNSCSNLSSISINSENSVYTSKNLSGQEYNCIINKQTKQLVRASKSGVIPSDGSVTSIGGWAYCGYNSLKSITIPSGVKTIGQCAFGNLTSLTSLSLPSGVTEIATQAFTGCTSLTSVTIPDTVKTIGAFAFQSCDSLTTLTIPESVNEAQNAFAFAQGLNRLTIESRELYKNMGDPFSYFQLWNTEIEFRVPKTFEEDTTMPFPFSYNSYVRVYGGDYYIYAKNTSLSGLYLVPSNDGYMINKVLNPTKTTFTIPESYNGTAIHTIGSYAFKDSHVNSLSLSNGLTTIAYAAFFNCSYLNNLIIPETVENIENGAFYGCISLSDIIILSADVFMQIDGISDSDQGGILRYAREVIITEETAYYATEYITNNFTSITADGFTVLRKYELTDGFNNISSNSEGYYTNSYTGTATEVYIPLKYQAYDITLISGQAFLNNKNIKYVNTGANIKVIGTYAFYGCANLTEIVIGSSVTSISENAFSGCTRLTNITIDSASIYNAATSVTALGELLANAKIIKVLKSADDGRNTYININFAKMEVGAYNIYVKK